MRYIDILNVSCKYSYEHIRNYVFPTFSEISFSEIMGMQNLIISCLRLKVLLRAWDLSRRVERHKLMATRKCCAGPKTAFTSRVQVDNIISAPIPYFTVSHKNILIILYKSRKVNNKLSVVVGGGRWW